MGQGRHRFRHISKNLIHLADMIHQHVVNHTFFIIRNRHWLHEPIYVKTVSFDGRNASRRCMGLFQVPFIFQILHFIADGRTGYTQIILFGNGTRPYRFGCIGIILHHSPKNFPFSFIQFIDTARDVVISIDFSCHMYHPIY